MKKILLLVLMFSLFIPFIVKAESLNIKTLEATMSDKTITVKGTVDEGVLAVAIMVYDSEEKNVIKFETAGVDEDNKFEYNVTVDKADKYIVKVANYDGGDYKKVLVNVDETKNPKTADNIVTYIIVGAVALIGIGILIYFKKKKV